MKLLANENFPLASVKYLRNSGFDFTSIGTDNSGISDEQVMDIAIYEERTILTFDSDYGELIFKYEYQPKAGVIFIRTLPGTPEEAGRLIEQLISSSEFEFRKTLTVIDTNGIRQRRY